MHKERIARRLEQLYLEIQSAQRPDYYDRLRAFQRLCTQTRELANLLTGLPVARFDISSHGLNLLHWNAIDWPEGDAGIAARWDALIQIVDAGLTSELSTYVASGNWRDACTQTLVQPVYHYLLHQLDDSSSIGESLHPRLAGDISFDTAFHSYNKVKILGEGGSGTVYQVTDESGENYALKCLNPHRVTMLKRKRFQNELFFCLRNPHRNIVKVLDFGTIALEGMNLPFYVMPYYPSTLRVLLRQGIAYSTALGLFSQMLDGVEAAHLQSIWHRDLKPENFLYDSNSGVLVVADFGIAHFAEEHLQTLIETKRNERLANFQYSAPEQRRPGQIVDQRADIYALGLILNEMFTGQVIQGTGYTTIGQVTPDYGYLDQIVESMLRQAPGDRPSSIDVIKQQLIMRGNEFVSQQKLSALRNSVVAVAEVDDPLVIDPPRVVGVDYRKGILYLQMNQRVSSDWTKIFYAMHIRHAPMDMRKQDFQFEGEQAHIRVAEGEAQKAIDIFKKYLEQAEGEYRKHVEGVLRDEREKERRRLDMQIQEEEARTKVLSSVNL